ncbi:hypothetical protein CSUI_001355, partial [Cystoisospora suis]
LAPVYGPYHFESSGSVSTQPQHGRPVKPWIVKAALGLVSTVLPRERGSFLSGLENVEVGHPGGPSRPLSSFPGLLPGPGMQHAVSTRAEPSGGMGPGPAEPLRQSTLSSVSLHLSAPSPSRVFPSSSPSFLAFVEETRAPPLPPRPTAERPVWHKAHRDMLARSSEQQRTIADPSRRVFP